tara:strand:- start:495 stop:719 length:225 start_codon:yes stop_codon:yes gene_type:complete
MSKVEEEEMLICDKCKKAYWVTKNDFFDHISECEGNKDDVIGITWWKEEELKNKLPRKESIDIGMKWVKRPETR